MNFIINLRDNELEGSFIIDLGGVFMFRWNGVEWVAIGEIKIFN
jgi:hypothetical protein